MIGFSPLEKPWSAGKSDRCKWTLEERHFSHHMVSLGATMIKQILRVAFLLPLLNPAWGKATMKVPLGRNPCTVFTVGPGTIISVHQLNLPLIELHYAVKYKTDAGQLIEVWTPGKGLVLLEGMHGELTYSTHPERILNFRPVRREVTDPRGLLPGSSDSPK